MNKIVVTLPARFVMATVDATQFDGLDAARDQESQSQTMGSEMGAAARGYALARYCPETLIQGVHRPRA